MALGGFGAVGGLSFPGFEDGGILRAAGARGAGGGGGGGASGAGRSRSLIFLFVRRMTRSSSSRNRTAGSEVVVKGRGET